MPKISFADHALHPQIIVAPAGLIPASLVFDALHAITGKEGYAQAAYYTLMGGTIGGVVAGVAGAADLLTIPDGDRARKVAILHGALNLSLLSLSGLNLLMRRGKAKPGPAPLLLNVVGNTGLLFSAWLGGELVYHYGMRVEGVSPVADAPDYELPGGKELGDTFRAIESGTLQSGL